MPIPDKPYTRKEAYLNAAATGDSSGIPETPYTREEMYLDAIARGGGGGGCGGSSTLSGLTDVDISNPTDGQTLVFNAESGKWENGQSGQIVIDLDRATKSVTIDEDEYDEIQVVVSDFAAYSGPFIIVPSTYFDRISNVALKHSEALLPFPDPQYNFEPITYASVAHGYPMRDQAGGSEPKLTISDESTVGYVVSDNHEYVLIPDTANFKTYLVIPGG